MRPERRPSRAVSRRSAMLCRAAFLVALVAAWMGLVGPAATAAGVQAQTVGSLMLTPSQSWFSAVVRPGT
jgi:hypothetical protein